MMGMPHEPLFPGVRFAHVLSLGADGEAAHGLRVADRHGTQGLFDGLVTPLDAVGRVLDDDGARLATRFIASHEGTSLRCGAYGMLYQHEFPRDDENRIVFDPEALEACRAKLSREMTAFLRACEGGDGPVLFLRVGLATNLPWDRLEYTKGDPGAVNLDALAATIARRFPRLDFRLLAAAIADRGDARPERPRDPRIAFVTLPRQEGEGWAVADGAWRELFSRVAFAGDRPLGETPHGLGIEAPAAEGAGPSGAQPTTFARTVEGGGQADPGSRGSTDGAGALASESPVSALRQARCPAAPAPDDPAPQAHLLDLALRQGDAEAALSSLATLVEGGHRAPEFAWTTGLDLWHGGRSAQAVRAFELAYGRGYRDLRFLRDYLGLLTGETRYRDVIDLAEALRQDGSAAAHPRGARHLAMLTGHAKLALAQPREAEIALAAARAASPRWLEAPALRETIAGAIAQRRPFSLIRLGDGEARYLLGETSHADGLTAEEAHAMGNVVWENWFGGPLSAVDAAQRANLRTAYEDAIRTADVVGACGPERLRMDTGHYGYLAWQERWLREKLVGYADLRFADAQMHRQLNADMPFFAALLEGQDVLGVISPHAGLADALGRRLRIGRVIGHTVPAEGRLPNAAETREALGPHFPAVYDRLLTTLSVPRPGCVFLVAAGLLGKIYCARIKALGGIALDIGALADAWMGFDTRDGRLANVAALEPAPPEPSLPPRRTTYGCVSFGKTGSMALADAVREAGFPDAVHLHYLGPRAIAAKRASPEPMLDLAIGIAGRIDDPNQDFRFVASVRDPIARILSQAFYRSERHREEHGVDIVRDPEALIAWWETTATARRDIWSFWFDDTFKTTFGFDFRAHPFDHGRKSIRYASDRLRLLVLRQEDEPSRREAELGWLLDRDDVALRAINDAANQGYEAAYRPFLESFAAPSAWLDSYYETDVVRHFYTAEERAAFKTRWSGGSRTRSIPVAQVGRSAPADPAAAGEARESGRSGEGGRPRTILCLSMMKTGSTALTEALREAGLGVEVAHLHHLGPRARARLPSGGRPVDEVAARLEEPDHRFAVVASVRDPIARWISQAFHNASAAEAGAGSDIVKDHDAFIAWIEAKASMDYASEWFDDSLRTPFGFDFRAHPFDHGRGSLRFSCDRLDLLILRQEDPSAGRETELGWLTGRDRIPIPRRNERRTGAFVDRYRSFQETFVAPDHWLDIFYETEVARHFYTETERAMFRMRWGRGRAQRVVPAEPAVPPHPEAEVVPLSASSGRADPQGDAANGPSPARSESGGAVAAQPSPPVEPGAAALELHRVSAALEALRGRLREGRAVDFNDYAYRPRERDWTGSPGAAGLRARFVAAEGAYASLLEQFCGFNERFRAIPVLPAEGAPHWEDPWLPGLDAVALYGLVATLAPRTYLEIGSGHSTRFVRRAIRDHGLPTRIVSVDPHPTEEIGALCDEVVQARCEDTPASVFAGLGAGDMLFFDGSHRSFQNSDATVFFTEILPAVPPGVVYRIHDIFLPYDYPESWTNRFYNEQYLLMSYLMGGAAGDEVLFPAHHVWREPCYAHLRNRLFLGSRHLDWLTSSFWMRRGGAP